jgi:benzoate membrane transport protein
MRAVPMLIIMGMAASVFVRFGLDLVRALYDGFSIAGPMKARALARLRQGVLGKPIVET